MVIVGRFCGWQEQLQMRLLNMVHIRVGIPPSVNSPGFP
jgi:hypothetical protein